MKNIVLLCCFVAAFAMGAGYVRIPDSECEIARTETTNGEYAKFVEETGARAPKYWKEGQFPEGKAEHPVVWVSYVDAENYCKWLDKREPEFAHRLPSLAEWDKAAGETPQDASFNCNIVLANKLLRENPWRKVVFVHPKSARKGEIVALNDVISISGNSVTGWANHRDNTGFIHTDLFKSINETGGNTSPVEAYAQTKTASGAVDMWGNCWEWTSTEITAVNGAEKGKKVNAVKGGSWYANRSSCLTSCKGEGRAPGIGYNTVGFRVVREKRRQGTYLSVEEMPDLIKCLPAPPTESDPAFAWDILRYQWGKKQRSDKARAELAISDSIWSYPALFNVFKEAFGLEITKEDTPETWKLLETSLMTTDQMRGAPKAFFHRRRPFAFFNEEPLSPENDEQWRNEGSYPSGHSVRGWCTALILAELKPERAEKIFARAIVHGESRVIAGAHWQSDIEASRSAASIGYARLQACPAFKEQMEKAKTELSAKKR